MSSFLFSQPVVSDKGQGRAAGPELDSAVRILPDNNVCEGANFWLSVLSDQQNHGVEDILIACVDGLTGFPEAINSIYPQTEVHVGKTR